MLIGNDIMHVYNTEITICIVITSIEKNEDSEKSGGFRKIQEGPRTSYGH